jgi:glycosyltransferase involved in cell wall biosynthesis
MTSTARVAVFLPSLFGGGAERVMLNLARGIARRGIAADLVLARTTGPYVDQVPAEVRVLDLEAASVSASLPALTRYLRRERPDALLSTLNTANVVAVLAKHFARASTRAVVRQANMLEPPARVDRPLTRWLIMRLVRWAYPHADGVIAVSEGVARDVAVATRVARERLHVVPNPVVDAELLEMAKAPPEHPWFADGDAPIILGVGRLTAQKDFATLLRAFAEVRRRRDARLVVFGEGPERASPGSYRIRSPPWPELGFSCSRRLGKACRAC